MEDLFILEEARPQVAEHLAQEAWVVGAMLVELKAGVPASQGQSPEAEVNPVASRPGATKR